MIVINDKKLMNEDIVITRLTKRLTRFSSESVEVKDKFDDTGILVPII